MSCYVITYNKEGRKTMRPVLTRDEYIALRDGGFQRNLVRKVREGETAMKAKLKQFCYSCIPGEDALLKGCKTPSMCVGMDVDLIRNENEDENEYMQRLASVPSLVLSKKDDLGLLMLERSASKGYHLVFRRRFLENLSPERLLENQESNLRWASQLLGVAYDSGAKDITRVFYTTTASEEDLLFLSDELFSLSALPDLSGNGAHTDLTGKGAHTDLTELTEFDDKTSSTDKEKSVSSVSSVRDKQEESSVRDTYQGYTFDSIITKYFELFNEGKTPTEGNRNVLTYELAMTLRPICEYSQERLEKVIPRYDGFPEDEWRKTIQNAVKEPHKGMPYRLRQVLQALKQDLKISLTGGSKDAPPMMPKRLPKLIKLLVSRSPNIYKMAVAEGVFPSLGAHLHGVKFRYWDNKLHEPTFMNVLIAPMSIGKGCITEPVDHIIEDLQEKDKPSRLREADWKRKNTANRNKPNDPRPTDICIQVLIDNLTDAVFNQRVIDLDANGQRFLYVRVDEIEQLKNITSYRSIDEVSVIMRKAFDNALHGQERVGSDSVSGFAPLRFNFNASTTIPNGKRFLRKAVNDGTLSRLNITTIIPVKGEDGQDDMPVYGDYDDEFKEELKIYLDRLSAASGEIECPQAVKLARQITKDNQRLAELFESQAFLKLSYRANVIAYLKGMLLYISEGYRWTKEIADYVRWSEQFDLWCKMRFFGEQLEREIASESELVSASPQNLLALLPEEFTYDEYISMRRSQGRHGDGKNTLRVWKNRGYIVYDEISGTWRKLAS